MGLDLLLGDGGGLNGTGQLGSGAVGLVVDSYHFLAGHGSGNLLVGLV